jgi:quinol monooxygenase YgiN
MLTRLGVKGLCLAVCLPALPPLAPGPAAGAEKEDPIIAFVKPRLKDPGKPFTLLVGVQVKEGAGARLEQAFAKAIRATRREKGCIAYDFNRDARDPTRYLVYERWQSLADLQAHLSTAHIKALRAVLADVLVGERDLRVLVPAGE